MFATLACEMVRGVLEKSVVNNDYHKDSLYRGLFLVQAY